MTLFAVYLFIVFCVTNFTSVCFEYPYWGSINHITGDYNGDFNNPKYRDTQITVTSAQNKDLAVSIP